MSAQHTPGPWEAVANGKGMPPVRIGHIVYDKQGGGYLSHCIAILQVKGHDETAANARLIAAAPDLLEACKRLMVCMSLAKWEGDDSAIFTRAAIEKATGAKP